MNLEKNQSNVTPSMAERLRCSGATQRPGFAGRSICMAYFSRELWGKLWLSICMLMAPATQGFPIPGL